jgi:hypothetical protein
MRRSLVASVLLVAVCLAGSSGAEPNRTEALAKAKAKFEADISKAEDALLASIDKALKGAGAANNKMLTEKLTYEREQFVGQRTVPTAVPTTAYLQKRAQAIAALEAAYNPAIKELVKAKKDDEAEAMESALSDLVRAARGYGLALPALERQSIAFIENKASGLALELVVRDTALRIILENKASKKNPGQGWLLDRDGKGFVLRNASRKDNVVIAAVGRGLTTDLLDPKKEAPESVLFQLVEVRRAVLIVPVTKNGAPGSVLTATEHKVKGVTTYELTLEKQETPPTPNQLWVITEAK